MLLLTCPLSEADARRAKFCLAPAGLGWGMQVSSAIARNCLPLVAQPGVVQPLEGAIDFHHWSLRATREQIVEQIVGAAGRGAEGLAALAPAFSWHDGGLAYNYTLLAPPPSRRATQDPQRISMCVALPGASAVQLVRRAAVREAARQLVDARREKCAPAAG